MYLARELTDQDGTTWAMAGVFDVACVMQSRFAALGYREVRTVASTLLGPAGTVIRGHEFHYSRTEGENPDADSVYSVTDRRGPNATCRGWVVNRTLGSYAHLHFGASPQVAEYFVAACREAREGK
jgi:cobyrinic acid a,c-diamide synthase